MEGDIDFKTQFFNIEGVHFAERKKNFYKLLRTIDPNSLAKQLDFKPRNYLEQIFYVDVLIRAKQSEKLLDILKEGNGVLISRILKQKWFFEEVFRNMSAQSIVNNFLPDLSYSLRMKVLKKMALTFNEEKMDNIFDALYERYGLFIAKQFLFSCSKDKIINTLKNNNALLSVEQLKRILDKDATLIKIYFDEYKKNTGEDYNNCDFLSYIVWKYPHLYFEFKNYLNGVKIGRNTTKTLLKINETDVVKDSEKLEKRFKMAVITRKVKYVDKNHLQKILPQNKNEFGNNFYQRKCMEFLKNYPKKLRWDLFSIAFSKTYMEDATKNLRLLNAAFADDLLCDDLKRQWAELKHGETDDLLYLNYLEPQRVFALIKEKINVTSDAWTREKMVSTLITVCQKNEDYKTYEEVLKYVVTRHRNEDSSFRANILRKIAENINYELSTEDFWKQINNLIELTRAKGEPLPFKNITQHLVLLFRRKLPVEEVMLQYLNDIANQKYGGWQFYDISDNKEVKNELVLIIRYCMKSLHNIEPETKRKYLATELADFIIAFNKENKDIIIDLGESPVIVQYMRDVIKTNTITDNQEDIKLLNNLLCFNFDGNAHTTLKVCEDRQLLDVIKNFCEISHKANQLADILLTAIQKPRTTDFQNELLEYYYSEFLPKRCSYYKIKAGVKYLFLKEPQLLSKVFDRLLPLEISESVLDYSLVKLYSHLDLDMKAINHFKPLLTVSSTCDSKTRLIKNLSRLMSTEDFIAIIKPYVPEKSKLDLTDLNQKSIYEAQCAIANALKNVVDVAKIIPILPSFCQGDYLQSSIPLLYKVLYRISEKQVFLFVNVLVDRGVSTRKHAIYLGFELLSQKTSLDLFNVISTKEKNISAKKYLFQGVLKYFLKNPSEHLLGLVVSSLTYIDRNDKELLETLAKSVDTIPNKFKPTFVEHVWAFLDNMEKSEVKVVEYKTLILSTINGYSVDFFLNLKTSFSQHLVSNNFFVSNDILNGGRIFHFVAKYLLAHKDDQAFKFIFDIVKKYKDRYWESGDKEKIKKLFSFFDCIYDEYLHEDVDFLKLFKTFWQHTFNLEDSFSEYVLLALMLSFKKTANIVEFSREVNKFFQQLSLEYGPYISDKLYYCLDIFFRSQAVATNETYKNELLALHLLNIEPNELNCFIASNIISDCDANEVRAQVIDILKSVQDFVVRIRVNDILRK